jgi:LPPG:FO 2-phospho-L-lactate transferase
MKVVALAGGVGGGRFLRGLARVVPGPDLTAIVNVADDVAIHGLRVSPDPDSVVYWLGDVADRERGWGRREETFRTTEELRRFGAPDAWFGLGDLDLATHLVRTRRLAEGAPLSAVTAEIAERFGVRTTVIPATDDPLETRIEVHDPATGELLDLHFQDYWVRRHGAEPVRAVRYRGADTATPAPGVLEAIAAADAVVISPSNPVVSIGPILAVEAIHVAVAARRSVAVGVSGIVGGAPVSGMADRLLPAVGIGVDAASVAASYAVVLSAWVLDVVDAALVPDVLAAGLRCVAVDTIMRDDDRAEALARAALELVT